MKTWKRFCFEIHTDNSGIRCRSNIRVLVKSAQSKPLSRFQNNSQFLQQFFVVSQFSSDRPYNAKNSLFPSAPKTGESVNPKFTKLISSAKSLTF